jgi:hypothetical protein
MEQKQELRCINCNMPRDKGRKLCKKCYLEIKRRSAKEHYNKFGRYNYGIVECERCKKEIRLCRKDQKLCLDCIIKIENELGNNTTNNYIIAPKTSKTYHRVLMEEALKRSLHYNEIVHHMDEDIYNNELSNLVVISRSNHFKLHKILIKYKYENKNYIKEDIISLTNSWFLENNINVIIAA